MTVRGSGGTIRVGPYDAASLGSWSLSGDGPYTLTAVAAMVNDYWVTQTPARVSVRMGSRVWAWTVTAMQRHGSELTATCEGAPSVE